MLSFMFGSEESNVRMSSLCGYLWKLKREKKNMVPQWNKRWFSIEGKFFRYYEQKDSKYPSATIDLRTVSDIDSVENQAPGMFGFFVQYPERKLTLRAGNQQEMSKWIRALRMQVDLAKGGQGTSSMVEKISPRNKSSRNMKKGDAKSGSLEAELDYTLKKLDDIQKEIQKKDDEDSRYGKSFKDDRRSSRDKMMKDDRRGSSSRNSNNDDFEIEKDNDDDDDDEDNSYLNVQTRVNKRVVSPRGSFKEGSSPRPNNNEGGLRSNNNYSKSSNRDYDYAEQDDRKPHPSVRNDVRNERPNERPPSSSRPSFSKPAEYDGATTNSSRSKRSNDDDEEENTSSRNSNSKQQQQQHRSSHHATEPSREPSRRNNNSLQNNFTQIDESIEQSNTNRSQSINPKPRTTSTSRPGREEAYMTSKASYDNEEEEEDFYIESDTPEIDYSNRKGNNYKANLKESNGRNSNNNRQQLSVPSQAQSVRSSYKPQDGRDRQEPGRTSASSTNSSHSRNDNSKKKPYRNDYSEDESVHYDDEYDRDLDDVSVEISVGNKSRQQQLSQREPLQTPGHTRGSRNYVNIPHRPLEVAAWS